VRSASPENLPKQSAAFLEKKVMGEGECAAHSPASARATSVLPVPGSPWSKMPLHSHPASQCLKTPHLCHNHNSQNSQTRVV
jgi:hypothetical protein